MIRCLADIALSSGYWVKLLLVPEILVGPHRSNFMKECKKPGARPGFEVVLRPVYSAGWFSGAAGAIPEAMNSARNQSWKARLARSERKSWRNSGKAAVSSASVTDTLRWV